MTNKTCPTCKTPVAGYGVVGCDKPHYPPQLSSQPVAESAGQGFEAPAGIPVVWTPEDEERLDKALDLMFKKAAPQPAPEQQEPEFGRLWALFRYPTPNCRVLVETRSLEPCDEVKEAVRKDGYQWVALVDESNLLAATHRAEALQRMEAEAFAQAKLAGERCGEQILRAEAAEASLKELSK